MAAAVVGMFVGEVTYAAVMPYIGKASCTI